MTLPTLLWALAIAVMAAPVIALADATQRRPVLGWMLAGGVCFGGKHLVLRNMPPWADTPLDAQGYALHADAFLHHWSSLPVDPLHHRLWGFLNNGWAQISGNPWWQPDADIPYASVFGTTEWLYSAFLGAHGTLGTDWESWAIASNVAMAALLPAVTWLLAKELGAGRWAATGAAALMAIDPTTSVNASWLLKDVLATVLAMWALLAATRLIRDEQGFTVPAAVLTLALALLSGTRLVGGLAIAIALVVVLVMTPRRSDGLLGSLLVAAGLSVAAYAVINYFPADVDAQRFIDALTGRLGATRDTMLASPQDAAFDPSVGDWTTRLQEDPLGAIAHAIARTLFAPYPWAVFKEPPTGLHHGELYLLGSTVWLLGLPLIALGMIHALRRRTSVDILLLTTVGTLAVVYVGVLGEWSTRQRAFMNPVFFAFFGLGLEKLKSWTAARQNYPKGHMDEGQVH